MDELHIYKRGQKVFVEDTNDVKGIFLILEGEFEISKSISKF